MPADRCRAWVQRARIPGRQRHPRCQVTAICDVRAGLARGLAGRFNIPEAAEDRQALMARPDLEVIDIASPSHALFELPGAGLPGRPSIGASAMTGCRYRSSGA